MPPPIRVLRAITRLNIGGPAIHAVLLTTALDDGAVFTSTLVAGATAPHEGDMLDFARAHDVEPLLVPALGREISPADDLVSLARMVQIIRGLKPDVVHTHMAKAGTVGRLAAHVCGVPLIVHTYHGHVFHGYFSPTKTRVFLGIERALGLATDRIVVVGDGQRDEIASYGVAPSHKLEPIRLGLELGQFLHAEDARGALRRELGIQSTTPLIGIVARLVPIKAHEVFFQAASRVLQDEPEARFIVVGDGERRAELERLVDRLGIRHAVMFLGWRRDMVSVYADLDVVALTSLNEGSPVALIEALAAARPVVSSRVGGVPEVVVEGVTGLTVPPANPTATADGLLRVLRDRDLAASLAAAGRRHVYPRYDSSRLVDDVKHLYLRELAVRGRVLPSVGAAVSMQGGG
ncbi:MAG: glycosyltransferase [Chloroflexi bacterium]|nr:glycosyltransferase [Chloroflexota bacterium]